MRSLAPEKSSDRTLVTFGLVVANAVSLGCLGCAGDDARFSVKYAPDFAENGATISVFGIFRDGRLSPEAWQEFGPTLSAPFGGRTCDGAYTASLISMNPALSSAADDYAKENGITDELLDQFAPAAEGKAILALAVVGHPPRKAAGGSEGSARATSTQPGTGLRGMGRGRRRQAAPSPGRASGPEPEAFQVFASVFSVRAHHSVATVGMTYSGADVDNALKLFTDRLATVVPGSMCSGWNWQAHIDDQRIRKMVEK